jgi:cellulose synthase/poly-beta-1,6-N-acetylglucosamine synthase-like glycosyltransferase
VSAITVGLLRDVLLALCLVGAWAIIGFYVVLTIAGYLYSHEARGRRPREPEEWPGVSILVPAYNEEIVMAGTLESLLHLDYPRDRLEIIVIDDSSADRTRRVVEHMMATDRRVKLIGIPPGLGGRGKSHALNQGLRYASHEVVAVYDADNAPEPHSLRLLVAELLSSEHLAAAVGKVRTLNRSTNLLTRCINIEFISFQWIIQAGRWRLFGLASLPGTNYVIWRHALERAGGWDTGAIADDAELTVRLGQEGYQVKFVPYAVTWEPEPQHWGVWLRQRLRWARGGTYVVRKFAPRLLRLRRRELILEVLHLLTIYHVFFVLLIMSDLIFVAGLLAGIASGAASSPLLLLWALALAIFLLQLALSLAVEREHGPFNLLVALAMYFTYCQLWIYVCAKAHYLDVVRQERLTWDKTVRVPLSARTSGS